MIRGRIDPGSAWLGVTVDAPPTTAAHVCRYVSARAFEVGRYVPHETPIERTTAPKTLDDGTVVPGKTWHERGRREMTDADEARCAALVVGYMLAHGVEEVTIEDVAGLYGATVQGVRAMGTELLKAGRVVTRIVVALEARGIPIVRKLATTWRARLVPLVKAGMAERGERIAGVVIKAKGKALAPLCAAVVEDWPGAAEWTDEQLPHVLDSTGLGIACSLPALPGAKRRARGPARPRAPRTGPRPKRDPMGPIDRAKRSRREKARREATRPARRAKLEAARVAAGCACPRLAGRHRRGCPLHVAKAGRCSCGARGGKHARRCELYAAQVAAGLDAWARYLDGR